MSCNIVVTDEFERQAKKLAKKYSSLKDKKLPSPFLLKNGWADCDEVEFSLLAVVFIVSIFILL